MITQKTLVLAVIGFFTFMTSTAQVGIGTTTPDASAILDTSSTTQGFLPPRMTEAERNAIAAPVAAGLIVWCTDCGDNGETQVYNGTAWTNMVGDPATRHTPVIGEAYLGGKVAYVLQSGDPGYDANLPHGIIAAPASLTGIAWGALNQNCGLTNGTAIGDGATNTANIIADCGAGGVAGACAAYSVTVNGIVYDDWHLPSQDELQQVYNNRVALGLSSYGRTWTSKQYNASYALYIDFGTGNLENGGAIGIYKNNTHSAQRYIPVMTF